MYTALLIVQVFIAAALIGLVLMEHGKGADAGAAFGSGASGTVFGSRGASSFLSRSTGLLATGFFVTSLVLAMLAAPGDGGQSVVDTGMAAEQGEQPAEAPAGEGDAPAPAPAQQEQGEVPPPPSE